MRLGNSNLLPVMGVLTIVAGAIGLQLGESAIAQIDPVHFQGPAPVPRDVSRDALPPRPPAYAEGYGWAEGGEALASDCGDCAAWNARRAAVAAWEPVYPEPLRERYVPASVPSYVPDEVQREREVEEWREVTRYTSYPVTQEHPEMERIVIETEPAGEDLPGL